MNALSTLDRFGMQLLFKPALMAIPVCAILAACGGSFPEGGPQEPTLAVGDTQETLRRDAPHESATARSPGAAAPLQQPALADCL